MPQKERLELIKKIQNIRQSIVICYLTSLRSNVPTQMAEDAVRVIFDHLLRLPEKPVKKLDIFLVSNGGSGTVPWRLVSLFREFAESFSVLIPYRAYSAASLLALGADEIVMHPFGELGPIDPTVSNDYNPVEQPTGRRMGISVEDVSAYINFIKSSVGITHEDELVKTVEILANKIHPLALGNVERFLSQSRMIAAKILRTHMKDEDDHTINEIVENMASKLYFHGHPINRKEAKDDLKLKVVADLPNELETTMWDLYLDYEIEFENLKAFNPAGDLATITPNPQGLREQTYELVHAIIESERQSSRHVTNRRYLMLQGQPGQVSIQEDILSQGWSHSQGSSVGHRRRQSSSSPGGARQPEGKRSKRQARSSPRSKA